MTTAEEERTETQPRREPHTIYYYRPDFCLDICKLPLSSGPKGPAIMTRTAYRLDVGKCTFVVAPIYNRGSLTPCAQFPRASRSPSQGKLWHVRSFWHCGRTSDAVKPPCPEKQFMLATEATTPNIQRCYHIILEVLAQMQVLMVHKIQIVPSRRVADGSLQCRSQSIPETLFDLTERSCCDACNRTGKQERLNQATCRDDPYVPEFRFLANDLTTEPSG